jgi:hypothetical protein
MDNFQYSMKSQYPISNQMLFCWKLKYWKFIGGLVIGNWKLIGDKHEKKISYR